MARPSLVLVTPALAAANNGNWQTARRWASMLAADYRVRVQLHWDGEPADAMIALHARRSADDVAAWHARHPGQPLVLALTGTDLYRDIAVDATAQRSLDCADRLVVLNERGPLMLPQPLRAKAVVCLQSSPTRRALPKTTRLLRALMVGHLRDEKRPQTYFAAARRLAGRCDILLDHIGGSLEPALGQAATALQREQPRYRWLGALDHMTTRRRIQQAHVLVHCSAMEGGAQVIIEAVACGTPVLASRIDGNLGLLGDDYAGCFDLGDDAALASLLQRCRDDPAWLPRLHAQCAARAPLFEPAHERHVLRTLMSDLLESRP
ncbi:selenoneine biosynthesis selenosugar synthase SenB [Ideonella sp. A 288]|uniref:selenoneine biosynthesis selenosugar synthase SenB n=1 Tax=Ideonella sp. A 288 TaxID=1962181 RepID=UPI000B4AC667|nr:selenoneine biosynthesis selenosugar synthase SenB [Ideonella sp. A 288]